MLVLVEVIAVKVLVSLLRGSVSTKRRSVRALLLGCLTGWGTSAAHGAESPVEPSGLPCSPAGASAGTSAGVLDIAALFGEFQCWLARGRYEESLAALDQACSASDDPACLFNRGLVHHAQLQLADATEAEHCAESRRNYAAYVNVSPYEVHAERARQALLELDQICGPAKVAPAPAIPVDPEAIPAWQGEVPPFRSAATPAAEEVALAAPAPDQAEAVRYRTTTWVLLGAGAASALAAVVAGLRTKEAWDDLKALELSPKELQDLGVTRRSEVNVYPYEETESLERRLTQYEVMTWSFGATAAVLLGIGIGRTVLDAGPAPSLAINAGPGFGGLSYGGEF